MAAKRKKGSDESLTSALARLLQKVILPDLDDRAKNHAVAAVLRQQHAHEQQNKRTADPFDDWAPRWLEQVAAAWVLSCVFLRTLEDRALVHHRRIAGDGAADAEQLFFDLAPYLNARDYLLTAFREVARLPGAEDLLGQAKNPAFRLSPSNDAARALLDFFRQQDDSGHRLRWRFDGNDTRFLGDLYQNLSESVRERFALLQTPHFVEKFILDLTLDPAIQTFGLEETHLIDPTCGSGHFLLGAFDRICEQSMRTAPGLDPREHALAALKQVHGVDLNPYAVAIAKFRLTLAYLEKAGLRGLWEVPRRLPIDVVVADSLLHGAKGTTRWLPGMTPPMFELEDPEAAAQLFGRKYQAVVGNPPYIVPRDKAQRDEYREHYKACHREYALAAPFTELFFQLGVEGGYVGLINANSFMKREFGKKLIEEVLPHINLTRVVDTSGAYIPGHGTPTVLLFGRNQRPTGATIRAVLGKHGEPETPADPRDGKVWSSIVAGYDNPSFETDFISVADIDRNRLSKHPWSLGGGGASELKVLLEQRAPVRLEQVVSDIGFSVITGEDSVLMGPRANYERVGLGAYIRRNVVGEEIRDWQIGWDYCVWTCTDMGERLLETEIGGVLQYLWPYRSALRERKAFSVPVEQKGIPWWALREVYSSRMKTPLTISFAFVATHNHFALDRGGKVFNRTAPIMKLPKEATEDDHLALLAYLNSSAACFWMKQVLSDKGSGGSDTGNRQPEPAKSRYEFAGTALLPLPVPSFADSTFVATLASDIDKIASARTQLVEDVIAGLNRESVEDAFQAHVTEASARDARMLARSIYLQECIDWRIYAAMGLAPASLAERLVPGSDTVIPLGERPFELQLARSGQVVGIDGQILRQHLTGSCLDDLRALWEDLVRAIRQSPELRVIEAPDYKRRWCITPKDMAGRVITFEDRVRDRLQAWLADRIEAKVRSNDAPLALRGVVDQLSHDSPFSVAAEHWSGTTDIRSVVEEFIRVDAVPYLAPFRYTDAGMEVHAQWERTWDFQRREDAGEKFSDPIPVPEKYDAKDFRDPNYFRIRGKLDVPKERFISYPGAETDDNPSPIFGWAGWNHLERATALAGLYQHRKTEEGWSAERLTPLLAGILELVPWIKQWHNEMNEEFGERLGDYYERYVDGEARALGLTLDALRAWRPAAGGRKGVRAKGRG